MTRFSKHWGRAIAALALAAMAAPAAATIIHKSYEFSAGGLGGPTPTHAGSFAISYDALSGDSVLTMIDFAVGATPFGLFNAGVAPHGFDPTQPRFILGGVRPGNAANAIEHGTDDFWLVFGADPDMGLHFAYSQVGADFYWTGGIALVEAAPVPEPAMWPLGLGALLALGLRRRRSARAA